MASTESVERSRRRWSRAAWQTCRGYPRSPATTSRRRATDAGRSPRVWARDRAPVPCCGATEATASASSCRLRGGRTVQAVSRRVALNLARNSGTRERREGEALVRFEALCGLDEPQEGHLANVAGVSGASRVPACDRLRESHVAEDQVLLLVATRDGRALKGLAGYAIFAMFAGFARNKRRVEHWCLNPTRLM